MPKMTRTQWYIPEDLKYMAEIEAKIQGVPVSEIFRQALENYLQTIQAKKPKQNPFAKIIGSIQGVRFSESDDPSSLSKEIDNIVYGNYD